MRLNSLFLILLITVILGMSAVVAEDINVSGHTFEIPNGYDVNKTTDEIVSLVCKNNTNYTIFVSSGEIPNSEIGKNSREIAGFKFLAEENYVLDNDINVTQENYIKNESYFSYYSFNVDDKPFLISYSFPVHDNDFDNEDNPVNAILESFK